MTAAAAAAPPSEASLLCPLCEYDLRGLTDPRCPECGYAFTWDELRDPARRLHPYLFEHHAERNVWSFRRTLLNSTFLPRRFWRTLFPTQPSSPCRLILYWLLVAAIAASPLLLSVGYHIWRSDQNARETRAAQLRTMTPQVRQNIAARYGSVQAWLDATWPLFPHRGYFRLGNLTYWWGLGGQLQVTAFALLWPWLTFLSLLVFQASMRRARVRPVHVLRCVVYSGDVAALAAAVACAVWFFYDPWLQRRMIWGYWWWRLSGARGALPLVALLLLLLTYRLWIAYRRYLRFDHPLATAVASQVMIGLLVLKLAADYYSSTGYGAW